MFAKNKWKPSRMNKYLQRWEKKEQDVEDLFSFFFFLWAYLIPMENGFNASRNNVKNSVEKKTQTRRLLFLSSVGTVASLTSWIHTDSTGHGYSQRPQGYLDYFQPMGRFFPALYSKHFSSHNLLFFALPFSLCLTLTLRLTFLSFFPVKFQH